MLRTAVTSMRDVLCRRLSASSVTSLRNSSTIAEFENTRTMTIRNGEKTRAFYSDAEVESRIAKLRCQMEQSGMAACVLTSRHNICYYTGGFIYCAFGRPYGLVVTPDNHCTVSALIDGSQPWRRSPHDNVIYTDWKRDNFFYAVSQLLRDVKGDVGIEFDDVTLERNAKLANCMPHNNKLVDIAETTMRMRMIKSQEEIDVIKNSAATCDVGGYAIRDALRPGVQEHEMALVGTAAMVRNIARLYPDSELMDTWVWFNTGVNSDGAHNPNTTRAVVPGDVISCNTFAMPQGHYTALERTMFLGHCPDDCLDIWQKNVKIHEHGIQLLKPGKKCSEVAHELNDLCAQLGVLQYRSFGYGHSFGVLCHYYGREAGLELREDIDTVLEPGMVISMEPMLMVPSGQPGAGGYREHNIVVLHHDGTTEDITKFPYGPEHNIIQH
ncbi:creatinase-like isoform X2 [Pollicipes pollicipes]|uniref:creatinase-like isoform X2 n=1 Tax=Pollicipes pollicipes TaxID=41117 RepID=UPI00188500FE|nr:creatinase-like isoform X2 [Pollicipes pollicipes]